MKLNMIKQKMLNAKIVKVAQVCFNNLFIKILNYINK